MAGEGEDRLALDEPEMRLPWLEAADDDWDEGLDWGRIGRFLAILGGVLALVAAGVWFTLSRVSAPPEGDGSIIHAPEEPYRVKPKDPGGKTFDGTGDTSYVVGEGIEKRAELGGQDDVRPAAAPINAPTAAPSADAGEDKPAPAPAPSPSKEPEIPGVGVQVGAYSTRSAALAGWQTLRQRYEPLGGYDRRIVEGRADIGIVYRLQAVAPTADAAHGLCTDLRRNGIECQVKR